MHAKCVGHVQQKRLAAVAQLNLPAQCITDCYMYSHHVSTHAIEHWREIVRSTECVGKWRQGIKHQGAPVELIITDWP